MSSTLICPQTGSCPDGGACVTALASSTPVRYAYSGSVCQAAQTGGMPPVCNTIANAAAVVTDQEVAEGNPTMTGGTITPGTYWLTEVTDYTGLDGGSGPLAFFLQATAVFTGSTIESIEGYGSSSTQIVSTDYSYTYTTSGTSLQTQFTCGADSNNAFFDTGDYPYTATATTITQVTSYISGGAFVYTWTLQP